MSDYIKSPINYTGNKYKLLGQIVPLFPKNVNRFVDIFGGSGTVLLNANAKSYTYNEYIKYVYDMFSGFVSDEYSYIIRRIDEIVAKYSLSRTNQDGYLKMRDDYNSGMGDWVMLYVLCSHAFNNQGRFSFGGNKFNMPFGWVKAYISDAQRDNIRRMKAKFDGRDVECLNLSFEQIDYSRFGNGDFVYFDPPYYGSLGVYNEKRKISADGKTNGWTLEQEAALYAIADELDSRGVRFALSNNLKYSNPLLEDFCKKYNTIHVDGKYSNVSYHKSDRAEDDEVLVMNYESVSNKMLF